MKKIFLMVASCFVLITASAQDVEVNEKYTASGGLLGALNFTKFNTDVDYDTKTGWSIGGWVSLPVGGMFSLEPQLMYSSYRYFTSSTPVGTSAPFLLADGKIRYFSVPLLLKFHAFNKLAITAGPQVDFLSNVADDKTQAVADDFNRTSFSISGGLELFPRGKVSVFGRYIHGLTNLENRSGHENSMEYRNQNIQVGLKLRLFGGTKEQTAYQATTVTIPDSDLDGITDDKDKCPNTPGIAKYEGCPAPDADGDGIADDVDKCPNQAGIAKYEGCPVPDSDGDGINDELDKCPNQAGVAEKDGCPVTDRDNDGINDDLDKCPDVAGVSGNNGCPEVPANVSKTLGLSSQNISFGSTNAKLTTRSNASLDQVVTIMNENPTLHIRVGAYTDNAGDDDANMTLTEDRAAAVKAYLVSKGIAEDRIVAEGFGETMPIADNNTSSGRLKNRRVEIRVEY
jgi:outer membrane protein OmpA-like peptidoglycan-associated protein